MSGYVDSESFKNEYQSVVASFQTLASIESPSRRAFAVYALAKRHDIPVGQFRRIYTAWSIENAGATA